MSTRHVRRPWSQSVTLKVGRGQHRKYLPYVFTEQGVAMLSSVLRSPQAVQVNIEIMRAFVRLRQLLQSNADLSRRLDNLERRSARDQSSRRVSPASRRNSSISTCKTGTSAFASSRKNWLRVTPANRAAISSDITRARTNASPPPT